MKYCIYESRKQHSACKPNRILSVHDEYDQALDALKDLYQYYNDNDIINSELIDDDDKTITICCWRDFIEYLDDDDDTEDDWYIERPNASQVTDRKLIFESVRH